jgi:lambda family phage portal protein
VTVAIRQPRPRSRDCQPVLIDHVQRAYTSLGYRSTSVATTEGRTYTRYPGSTYEERDRLKLIDQSRDFLRNNAIYKGMIERAVTYIVGNGFLPQVTASSTKQIAIIERLWKDWFRRPEIRNVLSGRKVSRMVMREILVAGDTAVLKTNESLIQLFEAEQINGPARDGFLNGVKKDAFGRPLKFQLCPWKNYGLNLTNAKAVDAKDVLFLTDPERPSQLRGIPICQAAFPMLHRINDVCDSEAIAWQLLSRLAVSVTRENGPEAAFIESKDDEDKSTEDKEGDLATRISELDYALMFHGKTGEEVKGIERNIPGMNFGESLRMFLRLLGLPMGLPLELILLDWTKSNYSQSRAVLEQAYENFVGWQEELIDGFYRPLFEWKLAQWQQTDGTGVSAAKGVEISWVTPTFPWIDQLKEVQAYGEQLDRGLNTHTEVCKSRHSDREEIVQLREREIRDAIRRAKAISTQEGVEVPWQIFAGLKIPEPAAIESDKSDKSDKSDESDKSDDKEQDDNA